MTNEDEYMARAIKLAERGRHRVMPNPLVGCVLVRGGEIIAEQDDEYTNEPDDHRDDAH